MRIFGLKISLSNKAESLPPASSAVAVDVLPGTGQAPPSIAGPEPKTEPSRPDQITARTDDVEVSSIGAPSRASSDSLLELEASNSEEHHYAERYAGLVLSAPGQEFQVAEPVQRVLALVESGYLLVSRDDPLHAAVWGLRERLDRAGHVLSRILYVEPATLLSLYQRHHDRVVARGAGADARPQSEAERYLARMLADAASVRASDVHLVVEGGQFGVQYRIDSRMEQMDRNAARLGYDVMRALYYVSDESEGGTPRTGEFQAAAVTGRKMTLPHGVQALRLQFGPLANQGHYATVRLLYVDSVEGAAQDESVLGYAGFQIQDLRRMRWLPYGLNIICGVTGSGKSTTLQYSLQVLIEERESAITVMTVEDPPEYRIPGTRQLPVVGSADARTSGFARAISAALRSDPDVIMIGEIRDGASADLAIRATQTGHQVWTTVHATCAARSLSRLIDEGVASFRILDSTFVTGLVGQRLVPLLCPRCAITWKQAEDSDRYLPAFLNQVLKMFEGHEQDLYTRVRVRKGADWCGENGCRAGYLGRTVIAEVLVPDEQFMQVYAKNGPSDAERDWIERMGGTTLLEHGLIKLLAGQIDPFDLDRVAGLSSFDASKRYDHVKARAIEEGLYPATVRAEPTDVDADLLALDTALTGPDLPHFD